MKRSWTVALFRHEQPGPDAWDAVERFVQDWSAGGGRPFAPVMDFMFQVNFDEASRPELDRLLGQLTELERTVGAVHHVSWRDALEEADYTNADFIELLGAELSTEPPFVLNEEDVLSPGGPCPQCGAQDIFDAVQTGPFVLDEARLDQPAADGERPGEGGWDVIVVANGHKLVSQRVQDRLADNDVRGYTLREVIDSRTGEPSERIAQIFATMATLIPCGEHSAVEDGAFCPTCGTAHGMLDGYFYVRDDQVGDAEVISRHPSKGALLYLSRRALALVSDLNGVTRNAVIKVCEH